MTISVIIPPSKSFHGNHFIVHIHLQWLRVARNGRTIAMVPTANPLPHPRGHWPQSQSHECPWLAIFLTRVVSKACETFMKNLEISRTVAHCTLKVEALLQYLKAQPNRCSTWRWFSAWLSVLQCSKHRILGAERSASAHDTAPSWNSSMVTTYEENAHGLMAQYNSLGIFWARSTTDVPAASMGND